MASELQGGSAAPELDLLRAPEHHHVDVARLVSIQDLWNPLTSAISPHSALSAPLS
ncbi:hypothetical protein NEOLEDRAFT_1180646 [Neolentinus lepideus HHB14362 ss-1]|uniref:Uncharacterized protein n=1 Tax=Neolentinus lepideus HHB14362 ss-1 TaxID=1314782 RepID=A0A165QQD2_9AGAM|nr:hypothetical protein NEOLEDRAFT_1180646 [Neolentinus lepideus HHB14362 ss-1]